MSLFDYDFRIPMFDPKTGLASSAFQEWVRLTKKDKMNRVEGGNANDIPVLDSNGHLSDSLKLMARPYAYMTVTDNKDGTITIESSDSLPFLNLSSLTITKDSVEQTIDFETTETYRVYARS